MELYYQHGGVTIYNTDAAQLYPQFEDGAFGLLFLDPPYYKVKRDKWDWQWDTPAQYLEWLGKHADQWRRILAPNGSLYVCASPQMAWNVEGVLRERFEVLSRVTWEKRDNGGNGQHKKQGPEKFRAYFPDYEVIFFCEQRGADSWAMGENGYNAKCDELRGFVFEPLRAYLDGERERAGLRIGDMNLICGTTFNQRNTNCVKIQWQMITEERYSALQKACKGFFTREYEDLRREYEDLRREYEDLRRPFNGTTERPFTSVWHYATVQAYNGKHPCEKPYEMLRDIIETSSRPDMLCADFFAGSGVFGAACRDLGRHVVLCEQSEHWARAAQQRVMGPPLLRLMRADDEPQQQTLLELQ